MSELHCGTSCLHCKLLKELREFYAAHPEQAKDPVRCIQEIAAAFGELLGVGIHERKVSELEAVELVSEFTAIISRQIAYSATAIWHKLVKQRSQQ